MRLSVVIPALNEGATIGEVLSPLQELRREGHELLLVDGGSGDGTVKQAQPLVDRCIVGPRGRAYQMNAGAALAAGDVLLFLHADTGLPPGAAAAIARAVEQGALWGRFDVALSGSHPLLRVVERMMNLRSRLTGIATGDQAMFVTARAFREAGGFPGIALMEDIALSRRLKCLGCPACLRLRVVTSSRRWETGGILRTIVLMWRVRLAYFLGAEPARLARLYRSEQKG